MPPSASRAVARLIALVKNRLYLFVDSNGTAYARVGVGTHKEVHEVAGKSFRNWLGKLQFDKFGPPGLNTIDSVVSQLEAEARFGGNPEGQVNVRVAQHEGAVYLDLGDAEWRVVRVTAGGWEILGEAPVLFRRPRGLAALPTPVQGGSIDELRPFLNTKDEDQFRFIVGFLVGALRPAPPYPVLELTGPQGAAKSTTAKILRRLIDPNNAPVRAPFSSEQDLAISANSGWLLVFDNLSKLSEVQSDALCRLSTGGGYSTRKLYTDDEETMFNLARPVIVNGIVDIATRPDLLERTISVELREIPPQKRLPESELWQRFDDAAPRVLGALLDAVAGILRDEKSLPRYDWPRMADFAKWVTAAERTLGWKPGTFVRLMARNKLDASHRVAEEHQGLIDALRKVVPDAAGSFDGTATELLARLDTVGGNSVGLPKQPNVLSAQLKRLEPILPSLGLKVTRYRQGSRGERRVAVERVPLPPVEEELDVAA